MQHVGSKAKNKEIMRLEKTHFECIQEDNSEEEQEKQWNHIKIVFDEFEKYLQDKEKSENIIERQLSNISFFVFNYFFIYDDDLNILDTNETTIRKFLGNWYIRKSFGTKFKTIKEILSALYDFFQFVKENGFITPEQFDEIKQVCKDKEWFENRLKTYKTVDRDGFREWIEEYNYDW